jgi:hypothetical protein
LHLALVRINYACSHPLIVMDYDTQTFPLRISYV